MNEKYYHIGFNHGYILKQERKEFLEALIESGGKKLQESSYGKGLIEGRNYVLEQEKEFVKPKVVKKKNNRKGGRGL